MFTPLVTERIVDYEGDYFLKILRHLRKTPRTAIFAPIGIHAGTEIMIPAGGKYTKRDNRRECKLPAGNFL
jgi:hypothetical protein